MSAERLQAMIAAACLGPAPVPTAPGELRAFFTEHGVAAEDVEALLAAPARLAVYRRLVRGNVVGVVETMLPRTKEKLEALAPGLFASTLDAFLAEVGPRTAHLRDVPFEVLAFAAPRWKADARLPPWLLDFAEYELADFAIDVAPRAAPPPPLGDPAPDKPLVFAEPRILLRTSFTVHEPDVVEKPTALLLYRDASHATRVLDLTPLAADILERLFAGRPLAAAVAEACAASSQDVTAEVLGGAAALLADLAERGVLLGARD